MRTITTLALTGSLLASNAFASVAPPLAPGKPAGVEKADLESGGVLLVIRVLGLAAAIALIAQGTQGNGSSATPTTSQ